MEILKKNAFIKMGKKLNKKREDCRIMDGVCSFQLKSYEYSEAIFRKILNQKPDLEVANKILSEIDKINEEK